MPKQLVPDRTGLISKDDAPVALAGVAITADVRGLCAKVTVAQRYINRETQPIEAVYVFPLDEGAAVCGFEAIIDGTLVVGEVKEREEAFRKYDDAMEAGDGAYLLDEERPDVFQASVGNLPPGKEVLLKITYVTELDVDGGGVRFVVPTTVSPRYAPHVDRVGVGRPDADVLNPAAAWTVPYGLDLTVRIAMPGGPTRVESPSHPISVVTEDSAVVVSLGQQQAALDRDFVLNVSAASLDAPRAWLERGDDGRQAVAVAFVPRFDAAASPAEVIFLIDRSGSMEGSSIEEVHNALIVCLRSMMAGCRFNIVGFGSTYESLFPESRHYDEASLNEASAHAASLMADMGGTEILPALRHVLELNRSELSRQVVVLTDGQVTNTDAVLELVRSHSSHTRVFSFGIGAGSSRHLVQGMAREGRGSAEFIAPGERIEPKVVRLFNRLLTPALTDVRVDWDGLPVVAAPSQVPPVFAGARMVVYGLVESVRPATIRLSATGPSGPVTFDVPLDPASAVPGSIVSTLAARARIRELEESPAWLAARGSRQGRSRTSDAVREIIELAVRYTLISRETSFVAVERREQPVQGDVQLRPVPIALTHGWGALQLLTRRIAKAMAAPPMVDPAVSASFRFRDAAPRRVMKACRKSPTPDEQDLMARVADPIPGRHELDSDDRVDYYLRSYERLERPWRDADAARVRMVAVVSLQRADGSWDLTEAFARAIGQPLDKLRAAQAGATGDADEVSRAWATALALHWLETNAAALAAEWRLLATKARHWLDRVATQPSSGRSWSDEAARQLGAV
jgi:Vault protein inter-alpha-trypsin domain/von Willebrand factor type A domain